MNNKINFLILGKITNSKNLLKLVRSLNKNPNIEQIYLSTWYEDIINYPVLNKILEKLDVCLIINRTPVFKDNLYYQMKSFENGLESIVNKDLKIFKFRADMQIENVAINKIINYDFSKQNKKIFKQKIWIPFYEISKPFYLSDECFYCCYEDALKLFNYEDKYREYKLSVGQAHIRRFVHPYLKKIPELEFFVKKFNFIGLGNDKRFEIFKNLLADKDFEIYFDFYLKILDSDFRIGINNNSTYLKHRVYSDGTFRPPVDQINKVMNQKNTILPGKQIFSYDEKLLNHWFSERGLRNKKNLLISNLLN